MGGTNFMGRLMELSGQSFLSSWSIEVGHVEGDEVGIVHWL
jgi:hypothetical protein